MRWGGGPTCWKLVGLDDLQLAPRAHRLRRDECLLDVVFELLDVLQDIPRVLAEESIADSPEEEAEERPPENRDSVNTTALAADI